MKSCLDKPTDYLDRTPINIGLYEIEYCPIHIHRDIEIVYVLKGSVKLKLSNEVVDLDEGDLYIINSNKLHDIHGLTKGNQMLLMRIDISHYEHIYKYINVMTFVADTVNKASCDRVKRDLTEIYKLVQSESAEESSIVELTDDIISVLVDKSQIPSCNEVAQIECVHRAMDYIYDNYNTDITLDSLAEAEQIDKYHLTQIFKYSFSCDFQELLDAVRIMESEKKLLETKDPIEKIAIDCGFPSLPHYTEKFRETFGETPASYQSKKLPFIISNLDIIGKEIKGVSI